MSTKKIKKMAVPTIYILAIVVFMTSLYLIQSIFNKNKFESSDMEYVDKEIVTDNIYIPVINQPPTIMKPYLNEAVYVSKTYYNYQGEAESQEDSIIYYENTYMQNSGIDYRYTDKFDIISILDGTVIEVTDNEILGKTIKIKHNNDLISIYQCLSSANVKANDTVLRGQVIGVSGVSSIYSTDNNLHFEMYYQGKNINPEEYYNKTQDEL